MSNWHAETGIWCQSSLIWDVDQSIPDDAPDVWFSKPNGDYYIGMSFHFSPFTFVKGNGLTDSNFSFKKSDFYLSRKALLHKDLKCKAPLIEPNLRRNLGKWST